MRLIEVSPDVQITIPLRTSKSSESQTSESLLMIALCANVSMSSPKPFSHAPVGMRVRPRRATIWKRLHSELEQESRTALEDGLKNLQL